MTKKQKLAISISSGFMVVILGVLSIVSSANVGEKNTQTKLSTPCVPGIQSITALSPNGGEIYLGGQQITVRWESCNIPSTDLVNILLNVPSMSWDIGLISNYTQNDGVEVVTLPTQATIPTFVYGKLFRINIALVTNSFPYPQDYSDNLFTINQQNSGGAIGCYVDQNFWGYDSSVNKWTQKADFLPGGRESAVGFSIGSKGYIGTGKDNNGAVHKDFWEWDQDTNVWTQKADFGGTARQQAVGFSIGNEGYIGTGYESAGYSNPTKDFWEWDLATNVWTKKADFGGGVRARATGFSIGNENNGVNLNKGYIGTGDQNGTLMKDFWEWDQATNVWTKKADFGGGPRIEASSFPLGHKGYIGTGSNYEQQPLNMPSTLYKDFWEWDQATNVWTKKADFGGGVRARAVGYSTLGEEKGYIGTGISTGLQKDFWEYDPGVNSWTQKADYGGGPIDNAVGFTVRNYGFIGIGTYCTPEPPPICIPDSWTKKADFGGSPRWFASGFSISNKGYIGSSGNDADPNDFWEWDQATNTWVRRANYAGGALHSSTSFSIGNLGYIGTGTGADYYKDFWAYSPSTNTWTKKADFGGLGRKDAAGFSINGKGYIGTGLRDDTHQMFKDFWEYNPATNAWTQKADFGGGLRFEAASFSLETTRKGYIGTGRDLQNNAYKDFWEWDQATNVWTKKADFGGGARHAATGISIGNKGYIGTGGSYFQSNASYHDFWKYDPLANTWTKKKDYPGVAGFQAVGFSIGNLGYIGTGYNFASGPAKDFWEYCPD